MTYSRLLSFVFALALVASPLAASAASTKVSCSLTVYTPRGEVQVTKADVLVKEGNEVRIAWNSTNAKKATSAKDAIALSGSEIVTASKSTTYTYTFSNGSRRATCSVGLVVASGSITVTSLSTDASKPILQGTASGIKTVQVTIKNADDDTVYRKELKIKKGKWEAKVTKSLPVGSYEVTLSGPKKLKLNEFERSYLNVLEKDSSTAPGTLSASGLPLLMGGNVSPGSSAPVAYIKVSNTGKTTASIEGFKLVENGTAPDDLVIGFSTSDDKGGSRTTIGGTEGTKQFKNGSVTVPLAATILPGEIRIFTIKAILSRYSGSSAGTQLKIDVAGVTGKSSVKGTYPIRGTTLTLTAY